MVRKKIRGHISFGKRGSGEVQCVALCDLPMFVSVFGGQRTVAPLWTSCRPDGESVRGAKKHKMFHLQWVALIIIKKLPPLRTFSGAATALEYCTYRSPP